MGLFDDEIFVEFGNEKWGPNTSTPLAKLSGENKAFIDQVQADTLIRREVLARDREYFRNNQSEEDHAG